MLHAYTVKENLRLLLAPPGTHPDREVISHLLWRFCSQAASSSPSPEVHRLAATIEAWSQPSRPPSPAATATATPDPGARTGSPNTKAATPSAAAASKTSDAAYGGPALVSTDEPQR